MSGSYKAGYGCSDVEMANVYDINKLALSQGRCFNSNLNFGDQVKRRYMEASSNGSVEKLLHKKTVALIPYVVEYLPGEDRYVFSDDVLTEVSLKPYVDTYANRKVQRDLFCVLADSDECEDRDVPELCQQAADVGAVVCPRGLVPYAQNWEYVDGEESTSDREFPDYLVDEPLTDSDEDIGQSVVSASGMVVPIQFSRAKPFCLPSFIRVEPVASVVAAIQARKNCLISAPAGYGKTAFLKNVVLPVLESMYTPIQLWKCASTGVASNNVGGSTIFSIAGVGRCKGAPQKLVKAMPKRARERWLTVCAIAVDEAAMLSKPFWDNFDAVARIMMGRRNPCFAKLPLGGLHVVVVLDAKQLCPVTDFEQQYVMELGCEMYVKLPVQFFFESQVWPLLKFNHYWLKNSWRYGQDDKLSELLLYIRDGIINERSWQLLMELCLNRVDPAVATTLCCRKREVRSINDGRLKKLLCNSGKEKKLFSYRAVDFKADGSTYVCQEGDGDDEVIDLSESYISESGYVRSLFSSIVAEAVVHLKRGASVILIVNIDAQLVNGCKGVVKDFRSVDDVFLEDYMTGKELPYNVTEDIVKKHFSSIHPGRRWPIVEFMCADGSLRRVTLLPHMFTVEDNTGHIICQRLQVPVILSYAMTVHKSQSLTLDKVIVHLENPFAYGQVYTALSRVRRFCDMRISSNLSSMMKLVSDKVVAWEAMAPWVVVDNS